jgi:biopolymer transport protein ExbD
MSPLQHIAVGIAHFLLGLLLIFAGGHSQPPYDPFAEVRDTPEGLFVLGFLAMSFFAVGVFYVLRGVYIGIGGEVRQRTVPKIFPEMELRSLTKGNVRSSSVSLVMASLNAFSVSWISVLLRLVIIFVLVEPPPSLGLSIYWSRGSSAFAEMNPWAETMSIYVAPPEQFLINGKAVKREELEAKLREELGRRTEWTVYVEANPDSMFADTVYAIDTIQGLGGKVVWITPKMRTTRCQFIHVWCDPNSPHSSQLVCDQSGWR